MLTSLSKDVRAVLLSLTFLVKGKLREVEARNFFESLGVSGVVAAAIVESYTRVATKYAVLMKNTQNLSKLHFKKLDWRFQVTVASRSLLSQNEAKVVAKVTLGSKVGEHDDQELAMEMNVKTLKMLVTKLEEADAESNNPLAKKLARN